MMDDDDVQAQVLLGSVRHRRVYHLGSGRGEPQLPCFRRVLFAWERINMDWNKVDATGLYSRQDKDIYIYMSKPEGVISDSPRPRRR